MTYHTDSVFSVATKEVEPSSRSKLVNIIPTTIDPKTLIAEVMGASMLKDAIDKLSRNGSLNVTLGEYESLKYDLCNHIQDIKVSMSVYIYIKNKIGNDRTSLYAHTGLHIEPIDDENAHLRIGFVKCYQMFEALMLDLRTRKGDGFIPSSREEHLHKCIVKYLKSMQRQLTTAN